MDDTRTQRQPKSTIRINRKFNRDESPGLFQNQSQNVLAKKSKAIDLEEQPKKVDYLAELRKNRIEEESKLGKKKRPIMEVLGGEEIQKMEEVRKKAERLLLHQN